MTTHGPVLPIWSCGGCDAPWPCRTRQRELRAEFDEAPISLALYLGAQLVRASEDRNQADRSVNKPSDLASSPVRPARREFFTKWFAFAGLQPGREWQPLILDDRVLKTLNVSLGVSLKRTAGDRRWASRYVTYVDCMHAWSAALTAMGMDCPAPRLEWVMFRHNGGALPFQGVANSRTQSGVNR